jgi:hypothetical protein
MNKYERMVERLHAFTILILRVGERSVSRDAGFISLKWACQHPVARELVGPKRETSAAAAAAADDDDDGDDDYPVVVPY